MTSNPPVESRNAFLAKRYKVSVACNTCRARKLKCDGIRPVCGRCSKRDDAGESCNYTTRPDVCASPRGPSARLTRKVKPSSLLSIPRSPALAELQSSNGTDGDGSHGIYPHGNAGEFASEVGAAIDARLGLLAPNKPCLVPMMDAPLFGSFSPPGNNDTSASQLANLLPPRRQADGLINIYWRYLHPLEPLLDQEKFSRSYRALYEGGDLGVEERIFVSILNTVFALTTQLQESLQPAEREEGSQAFFCRAWSLIRPEVIVFEPGSLQLVQCLLLVSRFLQGTDSPHQTWMVAGSAVRIALSLKLQGPYSSSAGNLDRDERLKRQVWLGCVSMDRELSWAFGPALTASLTAPFPTAYSSHSGRESTQLRDGQLMVYTSKMLELYEILGHITLAQIPSTTRFAESLGLPQLWQSTDLGIAAQLDACVRKWENNLPVFLRLDSATDSAQDASKRQRLVLHLRPMLARFCLSQSHAGAGDQGLGQHILRDCASLCVEASRSMIALIENNYSPGDDIGAIRWWHRIFYLYVATQHLIAAMLRPDTFGSVPTDDLAKVLSILQTHEHLSPCVGLYIKNFQTLAQKVSNIHNPGGGGGDAGVLAAEGPANNTAWVQGVFDDLGFETENWLFGMEDMPPWPGTGEWTSSA